MKALIRFAAAAATLIALVPQPVRAQDYPTRPVTMIVPWAAGGAVDTLARVAGPKLSERLRTRRGGEGAPGGAARVARVAGPKLSERLGKPVVIENRPGGGSTLGTNAGAKAPPDGYLLNM